MGFLKILHLNNSAQKAAIWKNIDARFTILFKNRFN
jgi:hypothetical protein